MYGIPIGVWQFKKKIDVLSRTSFVMKQEKEKINRKCIYSVILS